jgi:hypothetical protein
MARQLALIQQNERALRNLSVVVEQGFVCEAALERDPSFAILRTSPGYGPLLSLARQRRIAAHQIFLDAGGPELLSLTNAASGQSTTLETRSSP